MPSVTPVTWARPVVTPVRRPSWIGMARKPPSSEGQPAPGSAPASERLPPSAGQRARQSSPPASSAEASVERALASFSAAPIRTTREVELEGEVAMLHAEIARLARELASIPARVLEESEPELVRLAVAVAEKIVGRELVLDPHTIVSWIEEGLAALPKPDAAVIAVSPEIAAVLALDATADIGFVVDPSLRSGSCELRQGATTVSVGPSARTGAIADALGTAGEDR